jgi:hypothetical protein
MKQCSNKDYNEKKLINMVQSLLPIRNPNWKFLLIYYLTLPKVLKKVILAKISYK